MLKNHRSDQRDQRRDGRRYLHDIQIIRSEHYSEQLYGTPTDLVNIAAAVTKKFQATDGRCKRAVDVSDRFDAVTNALDFVERWAVTVHEARTTPDAIYIARRTRENSAALLMVQRQEFIRGCCDEESPISYVLLYAGSQLLVCRDEVHGQAETETEIVAFAKLHAALQNLDETSPAPAMPEALFAQQLSGLRAMRSALIAPEGEPEGKPEADAKPVASDEVEPAVDAVAEAAERLAV
jgi:hypothetical protein